MISFHTQTRFYIKERHRRRNWLESIAQGYRREIAELTYIFCSDDQLLEINRQHLNHDDYTDIITFDLSDGIPNEAIEGEIYISIDRVRDNARTHKVSSDQELTRVMAHGLLHLLGLGDKTESDAAQMRKGEELGIRNYELGVKN